MQQGTVTAGLILLALLLGGCSGGAGGDAAAVIRLQDLFEAAPGEAAPAPATEIPRTEWRFDDGAPLAWQASRGVEDLRLEGGRLTGRTTTGDYPVIAIERTEGLDSTDALYAVEVRARASAGTELKMWLHPAPALDVEALVIGTRGIGWPLVTTLLPGEEFQTYLLTPTITFAAGGGDFVGGNIRHVLLSPSNEAGAEFEIESVRLIFREEQLADIPSGVSWQGFQATFKETLITRAPESAQFDLDLPARPWLDLAVGTVEDLPVTFTVMADAGSGPKTLLERTVTTAERWETVPVELDEFANQRVRLSLSLTSEKPGALGFWGAPAVRNRSAPPAASEPPRGVILFLADTLRRDHLDVYGYARETAPTLAALASQGALFEDNISQATWTKVSVSSIHTSLYPRTHGVRNISDRLPVTATTLAEVYRDAGYATLSMSSIVFTGRGTNLHQGFETLHERGSIELPDEHASKTARSYVDHLVPWLEQHRDGPFFVFIHVFDPHDPYLPFRPYDTRWAPPGASTAQDALVEQVRPFIENPERRGRGSPVSSELAQAGIDPATFAQTDIDWYDGSIRAMDAELARLVEALEQLGIEDQTALAFIADHGEAFYEHGKPGHSAIYGELANVPLMLWAPGRIAPQRVSAMTQSIDLMPTLLGLSGLEVPEAAQGQSLLPLLSTASSSAEAGAQPTWRSGPAFTERIRTDIQVGTGDDEMPDAYSVIADGYKLVHNTWRPDGSDLPEYELFDHASDPLDRVDIAAQNPDVVERLVRLLGDWREFAEAARLPDDDSAAEGLDPAELRRLCSLGYIAC